MKKLIRRLRVIAVLTFLFFLSSKFLMWPVRITLPVRGNVFDATTGKPIENVVVSAGWGNVLIGPAGGSGRTAASAISVTDKEGEYRIPLKVLVYLVPVIYYFNEMRISFTHPLYEGSGMVVYELRSHRLPAKNGLIRYDVKLMSLEEKYVKPIENAKLKMTNENMKKLNDLGYGFGKYLRGQMDGVGGIVNFRHNGEYLFIAEEVFKEWGNLVERAISIFDKIGMRERADNLRLVFERTQKWILERRDT